MASALLDKGEERPVLGPDLGKGVAEGVELLAVDRTLGFGQVLVLGGEGSEYPSQLLATQVVDAGVAGEPKEPGFELLGRLEAGGARTILTKTICARSSTESLLPVMA